MESYNKQKWEDLNLSRDELKSIGEALKKEEFRNLLVEYVKEINDPENRKLYEKEITQLENERGVDIKFVHPSAGYVIKTSVDGKSKAFINICSNSNVKEPSSVPDVSEGHKGLRWSIPYCLAPPREDVDKKNSLCTVFDVVFHPDSLHMSKSNDAFKKLVEDTALGAVEEAFHVSLDKINLKYPKMNFKGTKHATVIRKKVKDIKSTEVFDLPNYPYPPPKEGNEYQPSQSSQTNYKTDETKELKYMTPKYTLKYRNTVDMQDYTNDPMTKMSVTIPNELVVIIDLPLLKHSSDASIDVTENSVFLISESPAKYKLILNLPYIVDEQRGNAKFDVVTKTLTVTLPVSKQKHSSKVDFTREDSGVDSDQCNGRRNSTSSSDDGDGAEKGQIEFKESELQKTDPDEAFQEGNGLRSRSQSFLKPNTHYSLPIYSCQIFGDFLNCTLQVPNVNPESVDYCFVDKSNYSGFQLTFLSMGNGFFPVNYAICVLLPSPNKINEDTFNVEVWDNNVVAQIKLSSHDELCEISVSLGPEETNVEKINLSITDPASIRGLGDDKLYDEKIGNEDVAEPTNSQQDNKCLSTSKRQENNLVYATECLIEEKSEENIIIGVDDKKEEKETENEGQGSKAEGAAEAGISNSPLQEASIASDPSPAAQRPTLKFRTMSESHQSESLGKNRGILKIGRSLSESSVDDYSWSAEKGKTKKTVRFSDVISRQTFRMNSSILGQRKKNQRKMKNKKRALERRLSESGNESEGDGETSVNEQMLAKGREQFNCNREADVWYQDGDSSSCDASDVSEVSDVSESDDGQKEDAKSFVPCSNKKNHKRRGKKSARKNAATAKFQFMEN